LVFKDLWEIKRSRITIKNLISRDPRGYYYYFKTAAASGDATFIY